MQTLRAQRTVDLAIDVVNQFGAQCDPGGPRIWRNARAKNARTYVDVESPVLRVSTRELRFGAVAGQSTTLDAMLIAELATGPWRFDLALTDDFNRRTLRGDSLWYRLNSGIQGDLPVFRRFRVLSRDRHFGFTPIAGDGQQRFRLDLHLNVPEETPSGVYRSTMVFSLYS